MTASATVGPTPDRGGVGRRAASVFKHIVRGRELQVYVWTICIAGLGLTAAMLVQTLLATEGPDAWRILLVAVLALGADRSLLEIRFGANHESFTWAEVCVVLGLFLVPLPLLIVLNTCGVLLYHVLKRTDAVKALFNAAAFGLGTGAAGAVFHLFAGPHEQTSVRSALVLAGAALVFSAWNGGAVTVAVALAGRVPFAEVYRKGLLLRSIVCVGNSAVGVGVLVMLQWSRPSVLILPPLLLLLYTAYRGYLHAMQERDVWQQLERAARELNQLDEVAVAEAAIVRAAQMLKADVVEITVEDGERTRSYCGDAHGLARGAAAVSLDPSGETHVMLYGAPLEGPRGRIGILRIGFRGQVTLTKREQQVLKTFAHAVSTTLQNARLYDEMREHADAKAYEAEHDALTGLGNRSLLHHRANLALSAAALDGTQCALLIIDLDHFKEINDTLGHAAGDVFLKQVGDRIKGALPHADAVCRLGGDEYAVLLGGLDEPESADLVAARLLEVLAEPVSFDGLRLSIEGSVGVACYPEDAATFDELLQRADVALYQAKDSRGSFAHYRVDRDVSSVQRLALAAELRTALMKDELVVHFQPQYDLRDGTIAGAEVLVRWQHPQRGLLQPGEFIAAVEHSGLIRDFTLAVLEKGVAECARWNQWGKDITVAVNLSARNLLDAQLPMDVAGVLARYDVPAERLILEITETTMMSELDVVESVLGQLRAMGVQLSVDDFGTGYSSLAFLQRVQVNEVKIDRGFVDGLCTNDNDRALVRATVQLAHSLGARCVGEGVETREQYDALRSLGCDFAQGYHLCRPVTAATMREQLGMTEVALPVQRPEADAARHLRAVNE